MDYSQERGGNEAANTASQGSSANAGIQRASAPAATAGAQAGTRAHLALQARDAGAVVHTVTPGPDGAVTLPAGTDLTTLDIDGNNLVVLLPDGSVLVIVGGAEDPPRVVLDGAVVPADAVATLISAAEAEPAAGPPGSSGGDFAVAVGGIGDGLGLTALLGPTALAFGSPSNEEIFPAPPPPAPTAGAPVLLNVREDDLAGGSSPAVPARGDGVATFTASVAPMTSFAFSTDLSGLTADTNGAAAGGAITWTRVSATQIVGAVNGVTAVTLTLTAPASIPGGATGSVAVSVVLSGPLAHTLGDNLATVLSLGSVSVVGTSNDGSAVVPISLNVIDDVPTAVADTASTANATPVTVNVMTNDVGGADGVGVGTNFTLTAATAAAGSGTVSFLPNGALTFTPTPGFTGNAVISYTVRDSDGDTSTSTLTVAVAAPIIPPAPGQQVVLTVREDDLVNGSSPNAPSTQTVSPSFTAGSNPITGFAFSTNLSGLTTDSNGAGAGGTITWVRVSPTQITGSVNGVVAVTLTLTSPPGGIAAGTTGSVTVTSVMTEEFANTFGDNIATVLNLGTVLVTGSSADGSATVVVNVQAVDDIPVAAPDSTTTADGVPVTYNVLANDAPGADGGSLTGATLTSGTGTVSFLPNGNITFTPTGGFSGVAVVTYSITDGDGDTVNSTLTITVGDSAPSVSGQVGLTVSEAALDLVKDPADLVAGSVVGSNAASGAETNATGVGNQLTFTASNDAITSVVLADPAVSVPTVTGLTAGYTISWALVGGQLQGTLMQGATNLGVALVVGISGTTTAAAGTSISPTLTATLADQLQHAIGSDVVVSNVGVVATDSDGSKITGFISLTVLDDGPSALPDGTATADTTPVTVNVIANDTGGADGNGVAPANLSLTAAALAVPANGTVTFNANGAVTFTPAAGFSGVAVINYTITDSDGDTATSFFSVEVSDSGPSVSGQVALGVSESALDLTQDPADLAPGVVTGSQGALSADETRATGAGNQLTFTASNDAIASVTFADPTVTVPTVAGLAAGYTLSWAIVGGQLQGTLMQGATNLGVVLIGGISGATTAAAGTSITPTITMTLVDQVQHAIGAAVVINNIGVVATDADGSKATGLITTFIGDDGPSASPDSTTTADAVAVTYNVITNDTGGADGNGAPPTNFSLTAATLTTGTGTVTFNADGNITFTPAPNSVSPAVITYTVTDSDGDTATSTLTVTINDSGPSVSGSAMLTVNEAALDLAQAGADLAAGVVTGSNAASTAETNATGVGNQMTFTAAADGIASVTFANPAVTVPSVTGLAAGYSLTWAVVAGQLQGTLMQGATNLGVALVAGISGATTATAGASINPTITVTLVDQVQHAAAANVVVSNVGVVATDGDGTTVTGLVAVTVLDDAPSAAPDSTTTADATAVTYNVITNDTGGADGNGVAPANLSLTAATLATGTGTVTFNANGEITFTPAAGSASPAVINYTITDSDGDTATSTLTVTITDSAPSVSGSVNLVVNEAALDLAQAGADLAAGVVTGSNAVSTDETKATGVGNQLTFTANADAIVSVAFADPSVTVPSVAGLAAGYSLTWAVVAGQLQGTLMQGATNLGVALVAGISGATTAASGVAIAPTITVTLVDQVQHAAAANVVVSNIGVVATDADGTPVTGLISVTVLDDVPSASPDSTTTADATAVTYNVITNDTGGADGNGAPPTNFSLTAASLVTGSGTVTFNANGNITFTPTPGSVSPAVINYTVTDSDGDTATSTLTVTINDSGPSVSGAVSLTVNEAALDLAQAGADLAAGVVTGSNAASTAETNATGVGNQLTFTAAADGIASVAFANPAVIVPSVTGLAAGYSLTWAVVAGQLQGTLMQGATNLGVAVVAAISGSTTAAAGASINPTITVTLVDQVQHAAAANVVVSNVGVVATDGDGTTVTGLISVTVLDDVPSASPDSTTTADATAVTYNVITNDTGGADGNGAPPTNFSLTAASLVTGSGTVTFNANGNITFTPTPGSVSPAVINYTVTDSDGDTATSTLTVTINDSGPSVSGSVSLVVNEAALDLSQGGADLVAGVVTGSNAASPDETKVTGAGNQLTFTAAADGIASVVLANPASTVPSVTGLAAGYTLTWALVGGQLQGTLMQGATNLGVALVVGISGTTTAAAGASISPTITATLSDQVQHAAAANVVVSNIGVVATDGDGTPVTGLISVTILDDGPSAVADATSTADATLVTYNVMTNDTGGADGNGAPPTNFSLTAASLATGSGTVTFNANGNISFTPTAGSISPAVINYTVTDSDGDTATSTLTITVSDSGPSVSGSVSLTVNEAALDLTQTGADLVAGVVTGSNAASPDETKASGAGNQLTFTAAADAIASIVLANPASTVPSVTGLAAGYTMTWALVGGQLQGALMQGATNLGVALVVGISGPTTAAAGASVTPTITATLSDQVQHAAAANVVVSNIGVVATDADGTPVTGLISVTILDDGPSAVADTTSTNDSTPVTYNVMANDVGGADGNGAPPTNFSLTAASLAVPANGTVSFNANGNITYTPVGGAISPVVINYTVTDSDGDTATSTLTITVGDSVPTVAGTVNLTVNEAALDLTQTGADLVAGVVTGSNPSSTDETKTTGVGNQLTFTAASDAITGIVLASPAVTVPSVAGLAAGYTMTWALVGGQLQGTLMQGATNLGVALVVGISGATTAAAGASVTPTLTATLSDQLQHAAAANVVVSNIGVVATDADGSKATGLISVTVLDDLPSFAQAPQSQTVSNDTTQTAAVGALYAHANADGYLSTGGVTGMTFANTTSATSGGKNIVTSFANGTLIGWQDVGAAGFDGSETVKVFELSTNLSAGAAGRYTFDLMTALDGDIVPTPISSASAFGVGPAGFQVVSSAAAVPLALLDGWTVSGFNTTTWAATSYTVGGVNGSTGGWGVNSNSFAAGQLIRFDFNQGDAGYAGVVPPTTYDGQMPQISYATFEMPGFKNGDVVFYKAFYETPAEGNNAGSVIHQLTNAELTGSFTVTAPLGTYLDYIEVTVVSGNGKITLVTEGVLTPNIDETFTFTATITDGDNDAATSSAFTVNVKTGNTPAVVAAPVVLDLDGDGVHYLTQAAGVTYDYANDGTKQATAWAAPSDGLLVYDGDGNHAASNASEFVFTSRGFSDVSDLAAVRAEFDSNADGKLTAADAQFAAFGVWQDANSDGVADAGEFKSLAELGIVSVDLVSDGKAYFAADGEVEVAGEATFTRADGSTGALADVSFLAAGSSTSALRQAEGQLAANSNANGTVNALLAAGLAATLATPQPQASEEHENHQTVVSATLDPAPAASTEAHMSATGETAVHVAAEPVDTPASAPAQETSHLAAPETASAAHMADASAYASAGYGDDASGSAPGLQALAGLVDASAMPTVGSTDLAGALPVVAPADAAAVASVIADAVGDNGTVDHLLTALGADPAATPVLDAGAAGHLADAAADFGYVSHDALAAYDQSANGNI